MTASPQPEASAGAAGEHARRLDYRPDIDGLRTVAIVSVIAFHAFPNWVGGGFVGVDVFFVISGYLITGLILRGLPSDPAATREFSLRSFYAHRVRRIFPALAVVLIACLTAGWFLFLADEYKQLGKQVVAGAAFAENVVLWSETGYFDTAAELKPLLHLWSLGIEEQFYLAWPLLLVAATRLRLSVLGLIAGIAAASFAANILTLPTDAAVAFYSPLTRMWELMLGGALACLRTDRAGAAGTRPGGASADAKSWAGIALVLAGVFLLDGKDPFPGWRALLPTLGACLLIAGGMEAWINRRILASRVFVFIGLISYPLYLWHWPLLSFARIVRGDSPDTATRLAAIAAALVLAFLTWWLVERRLRFREHWAITAMLSGVLVVLAAAGLNIFQRDGLEFRLKGSELQRVKFNITLSYQTQCRRDFEFARSSFCLRGSEDRPPTVALIGDSHAMTLYPGLGSHYAQRGENLVHFGIGGGIPYRGVERIVDGAPSRYYADLYASILDHVAKDAGIKTVILMNRSLGRHPNEDRLQDVSDPANTDTLDIYGKAMARTLKSLLAANKEVVVILDNPMMDFDPGTCIPRPGNLAAVRQPCARPRQQYDNEIAAYRRKLEEVLAAFPSVKRWDPAAHLCDAQYCWAMKDDKMLYGRDGEHLSIAASYWLAARFSPR